MYKLLVFVFVLYFNFLDGSISNDPFHGHSRVSITPSGNILNFHNVTIYLGYANNPFDVSTPALFNMNKEKVFMQELLRSKAPPSDSPLFNQITAQDQRSKRGVIHLYNMVSCATGCNPLIYKGYGCYCGFLGSGYVVDGIDSCCKNHDWCYETANCPMFFEYFVPYYWKCYHGRPLCAIPPDQLGGPGSCPQRLCECDRALSECLRQYPCPSKRAVCKSSPWRLIQNALMGF